MATTITSAQLASTRGRARPRGTARLVRRLAVGLDVDALRVAAALALDELARDERPRDN